MLSCCHSFSTQCIQSLVTGTNSLTCPSCHQTTQVPSSGVTSLSCNFHLVNKQGDILNKITSNLHSPCDLFSENTSVVYRMQRSLLSAILRCSQRVRSSCAHSSFTLEEACAMSQDTLTKIISSFIHTCQDHSD